MSTILPASRPPVPRPVAVLGVDSPIGLTVIRELGSHGVPVIALGKDARALGRYSRHTHQFEVMPKAPMAQWLPDFAAQHNLGAIMAIAEHHLLELAPLKGMLGDCTVICPAAKALDLVLDKRRTLAIAATLGIDVPESWLPAAGEDIPAIAARIAYPVAIKWPDPNEVSPLLERHGLALEKVEYADSAAALLAILARYDAIGRYPLVQTWCPGVGLGQMLHMHHGHATLRFQHERLREFPPSGGVSSFCGAIPLNLHAAQMAQSERLLQAMDWQGPAMVEYRYDAACGKYWLMEVNGRFWGSLPLASHCGAQFAWETWRCQAGHGPADQPSPCQPSPRQRRARYAIPDAKHIVAVLRDGTRSLPARLASAVTFIADFLDPRVRYYVWSFSDPKPMLADLLNVISKIVR